MILLAAVILIGAIWKRTKKLWAHGIGAFVFQAVMGFLFYAGGTLEDPSRDGIITRMIRQATDNGPLMGALGIPVIVLYWAIPIWLMVRGMKPFRSSLTENQET